MKITENRLFYYIDSLSLTLGDSLHKHTHMELTYFTLELHRVHVEQTIL